MGDESKLLEEIAELQSLLRAKETELANLRRQKQISQEYGLNNDEINRYSRQIFLPEIGVQGGFMIFFNLFLIFFSLIYFLFKEWTQNTLFIIIIFFKQITLV